MKVGKTVTFGNEADVRVGNRKALKSIPVGTIVYNVELFPGKRGQELRRVETAVSRWVETYRKTGHTWSEIGSALGVSRQAAWRKYKDTARTEAEKGRRASQEKP